MISPGEIVQPSKLYTYSACLWYTPIFLCWSFYCIVFITCNWYCNKFSFNPCMNDFTAQDESLYDAAQTIEYLDMVWQESLRMYPPAGMWVGAIYSAMSLVKVKLLVCKVCLSWCQETDLELHIWLHFFLLLRMCTNTGLYEDATRTLWWMEYQLKKAILLLFLCSTCIRAMTTGLIQRLSTLRGWGVYIAHEHANRHTYTHVCHSLLISLPLL